MIFTLFRVTCIDWLLFLTLSDVEEGGEDGQSSASKRAKRNVPKSVIPVIAVNND